MRIRDVLIISSVILIPSWTVAYVTEQVIYVIPMLAVCTFIVAQLFSNQSKRIEDDGTTGLKIEEPFNYEQSVTRVIRKGKDRIKRMSKGIFP